MNATPSTQDPERWTIHVSAITPDERAEVVNMLAIHSRRSPAIRRLYAAIILAQEVQA